jgi:hypothetical protein
MWFTYATSTEVDETLVDEGFTDVETGGTWDMLGML